MLINKVIKARRCKKGFTLLEVIISFALISIILIPIANMVLTSVKINKTTEDKQQAKAMLQETIENIKSIENLSALVVNPLSNGVILDKEMDEAGKIMYSLRGQINGFSIEGSIREKSVVTNNEINKMRVDKTIYFHKGSVSISNGDSTIEDAIKKSSDNLATPSEEAAIEMRESGEIEITYGISKNIVTIPEPENNAILICLGDNEKGKLKVNIKNDSKINNLKIYLYNGEKVSQRDDIVISKFQGNIELIEGIQDSENIINEKLYFVELNASKGGEIIENINLDLIK